MTDKVAELWQRQAEQLGGGELVQIISDMQETQKGILATLSAMEIRHAAAENTLAITVKAFPSGDIDGHRRYHETMIETLAERRRLRIAVQEKTISGLVWAIIVFLGFLMIKGIPDATQAWISWFTHSSSSQ